MKKTLFALAMGASLMFTACSNGKPDLDDPKAVAEFTCKKMKEAMELMKDTEANAAKIEAMDKEMTAFDNEFKAHHGEKAHEMQLKVDESLAVVCKDLVPTGM